MTNKSEHCYSFALASANGVGVFIIDTTKDALSISREDVFLESKVINAIVVVPSRVNMLLAFEHEADSYYLINVEKR